MSQLNRWFRHHQKKFLVAICVLIMVAWIILPAISRLVTTKTASGGEIFGESVSGNHLLGVEQRLRSLYPEAGLPDKLIPALAWRQLILLHEADRLGIQVTDSEIDTALRSMRQFQGIEGFDGKMYGDYLRRRGLTSSDFESELAGQIRIGKLQDVVLGGVKVTDGEAWQWYQWQHEQLVVRYAQIPAEKLTGLVSVTETALRRFYADHADVLAGQSPDGVGYKLPEQVKIDYLIAPVRDLETEVVVTERMIKSYYDEHKESYKIAPPPVTDKDKKDGESAPAYQPLAEVSAPIERALRQQEAKRLSAAVMDRIDEAIGQRIETADEASGQVQLDFRALAREFKHVQAVQTGYFTRDESARALAGAYGLAQAAFGKGVAQRYVPSQPMESGNGSFIFQIVATQLPHTPPFDAPGMQEQVTADYRRAKAEELAAQVAENAGAQPDFDAAAAYIKRTLAARAAQIADEEKKSAPATEPGPAGGGEKPAPEKKPQPEYVTVGTAGPFGRPLEFRGMRLAQIPGLPGNPVAVADTAFELAPGKLGVAKEGRPVPVVYLLAVTKRIPASRQTFLAGKEAAEQQLRGQKQQAVWTAWMESIMTRANPSKNVNEELAKLGAFAGL